MNKADMVLVIEANARAAVDVVRSLMRHGVRVIAASSYRWCASYYVRGLRRRLRHPSVVTQPGQFIEWLRTILQKYRVTMLLPLGDVATALVVRHRDVIQSRTRLFLPPWNCFVQAHDKILTNKAAVAAGVAIPASGYPDEEGLEDVARSMNYPVIIKPTIGVGARDFTYARSPEELRSIWAGLPKGENRYFVQEFIPAGRQYVVDILLNRDHQTVAAVTSEKVHRYPVNAGASTLSRSVLRDDLCCIAETVLHAIGYYGVANVDLIEDTRDGSIRLLEINPRFGEMHAICQCVGVDLPWLMYCLAMDHPTPPATPRKTEMYLRCLPTELMWFLRSPERWFSRPSFWDTLNGRVQDVLFSGCNFGPLIGYGLEILSLLSHPGSLIQRFQR